jgi:protein involved in polysaccharide export with SLBB domain
MKMTFTNLTLCFALAAVLAVPGGALGQTNEPAQAAPADSSGISAYHVVPNDTLTITVAGEKDLTGDYLVSNDGKIRFPLIEEVSIAGLKPDEIEVKIKRLLEADYLVHAYVGVNVKNFRQKVVSVLGEVFKPGPVEYSGVKPMSLPEALSRVSGWTLKANIKDIIITRQNKIIHFNLDKYQKNPKDNPAPDLEDGDVVTVKQSVF